MDKRQQRLKRHYRLRKKIMGTDKNPRLAVFRSNQHIYAQIIDDQKHITLISGSDLGLEKGTKSELAYKVGRLVAAKAVKKGIKTVVFDRGGYLYHGRIAKLVEGARSGGLKF